MSTDCATRFPAYNLNTPGNGGNQNVSNYAFGTNALSNMQNAAAFASPSFQNQAFGINAGSSIPGGDPAMADSFSNSNIAIGYNALSSTLNGSYNIAIGSNAFAKLATGVKNIAVGANAGAITVDAGRNNVLIGTNTSIGDNVSYSVAIGHGASVTTDSTIVLGGDTNTSVKCNGISVKTSTTVQLPHKWYYEVSSNPAIGIVKTF